MQTIHFEDQGQDFLEWDIDQEGVVMDSRPFQADVWRGSVVTNLAVGFPPTVKGSRVGTPRVLRYAVMKLEQINPFIPDGRGYGAVDTDSRIRALEDFDLIQCRAALELPGLQKTVEKKLRSRIRRLEQQEAVGKEE